MIGIVDYGAGNIRSLTNAFASVGAEVEVIEDPGRIQAAKALVLPGVGAFGDGMRGLAARGFVAPLTEAVMADKTPFLGICLGMQLIARESTESPGVVGLGWIDATVERLAPTDPGCKVPQMGWNGADVIAESPLYAGLGESPVFYFLHSYHLVPRDGAPVVVTATFSHGGTFAASVDQDNVSAVQFHPEKSQEDGITLIRNFLLTVKEHSDCCASA